MSWFVCVTLSQCMFLLVPKGTFTLPHSRNRFGYWAGYLRVLVSVEKSMALLAIYLVAEAQMLGPTTLPLRSDVYGLSDDRHG